MGSVPAARKQAMIFPVVCPVLPDFVLSSTIFFADFFFVYHMFALILVFFLFCFETIRSFSFIFPLIIFTLRSAFEKHLKCLPTLNPEIASDSYLCSIDPLFVLG
uniref:(northern house mosquito) hypothetical protein n=1 Tax=Culex pipiens TaxID=7175 RepID=A0A8D8ADV6_CULPI